MSLQLKALDALYYEIHNLSDSSFTYPYFNISTQKTISIWENEKA